MVFSENIKFNYYLLQLSVKCQQNVLRFKAKNYNN